MDPSDIPYTMDPSDIPFEEYLERKGKGGTGYDAPVIRVRNNGAYVSEEACRFLGVCSKDQFVTAPNPSSDGTEFYLCKTTGGRGWTVSSRSQMSGASASENMVMKLGEEFEEPRLYELEETGMTHPEWETPIFLATPRDE